MGGNRGAFEYSYWIAFSLLLMCCLKACNCISNAAVEVHGCKERERKALLQFKGGVVDNFGMLSSWGNITGGEDDDDCCQWRGVECDNHTGHVITLDLSFQYLEGKILGGASSSLAELQHLKHLNLSGNEFEGIIPTQLGNLSNLQSLDLSSNNFEGSIPAQLGNLSNLQSLDLSYNSEEMRCERLDWLSGLLLLTYLDLSQVSLSAAIRWPEAINKMPNSLTELYLRNTGLPTIIPSIPPISHINSSTTSLEVLDLSGNGLTSSIYPWLFNSMNSLVHLALSGNDLDGSFPDALIGNQTSPLAYLDLSTNQLHSISDAFGNMTTLTHLDLSDNQLHSISNAFGNQTSLLAYLDLSWNQLQGEIPKSWRVLCNLRTLDLSYNNLTGLLEEDFLAWYNNTLEHLDLSYNQLSSTSFPHLNGFSRLKQLNLGFNKLNGTLPQSIGQLPLLEMLDISSNSLQGIVSANHLFGLSNLIVLDLSFNSLTFNISLHQLPQFQAKYITLASCKLGPRFPNWIQTQKRLMGLDISASGISDALPNWILNLSSNLTWLNISNNHISGSFPDIQSTPIYELDSSSNCLEGSIPQSLFNSSLWYLDLSKNMFSGSISLSCKSTDNSRERLYYLDLSDNRLSGKLPKCWDQWKHLGVLNLANNNFSGKIRHSISLLEKIYILHLRNNSFIGALPSSLKKCKDLQLIDLGKNKLSGRIPSRIGRSLSNLIVLNLGSNQFNGNIPLSLCRLENIQLLDLSSNNLSGTIPECLNNLTAVARNGSTSIVPHIYNRGIDVDFENIAYTFVQWKGKEVEYKETLRFVKSIDLSNNKLIGEIPAQVTDLVDLVALNLSRNHLSGPIPSTIGQLKSLDFLDLSHNQLNGGIPNSLAQVPRLSVLDLSNNNLSGKIPSSTQLQSFNASTYEENPELCGPPLPEMCPEDEDKPKEFPFTGMHGSKEDEIQDVWFYGNIVFGFIIGFWGVCGSLLLNRSWRIAYFQFLNNMKDRLYVATTIHVNRL